MTEATTCPCGQPAHNSRLCPSCTARLTNAFPTVAELWRQIEVRMSKESGVDYRGRGGSRSSVPPSVVTDHITELRTTVRATITNAAATLVEQHPAIAPVMRLRDTVPYLCIALHQYATHLAGSEDAPRLLHALTGNIDDLTRAIDTPPGRVYAGTCNGVGLIGPDGVPQPADPDNPPCDRELHIPEEGRHEKATVRCPDCGATYSLAIRKEWVLEQYIGKLVTPSQAAALMGIPRNTVNQWAKRKRIIRKGSAEGSPLYLVDDLLELARTTRKEDAA